MAEAIDELFVKLGLESDQQQFKQAESSFDGLRRTALQAGAAIGAGFGLNELTVQFAQTTDEMNRFAEIYGVAPQFVNELGFAFKQTGGDAADAFSSIRNVADLIESTQWGEIPQDAFREFGVDPMLLQGVESVAEAYDRIMNATDNLDPETARRFFGAMGLSEADLRLAQGQGDESFEALMEEGRRRSQLTESMLENARAFTRGQGQLTESISGLSNTISDMFVGDLGEAMSELADVLDDNRSGIADFIDGALPYLEATAVGVATLVALQGGKKGLAALGGVASRVPAIAAVAGGYAFLKDDPTYFGDSSAAFNSSTERTKRQIERLTGFDLFDNGNEAGRDGVTREEFESIRSGSDVPAVYDPDADRRSMEDWRWLDESGYREGDLDNLPPDTPLSSTGNQTNIELNVDARGSRDPAATEMAVQRGVDRALARAAENAMIDLSSRVS